MGISDRDYKRRLRKWPKQHRGLFDIHPAIAWAFIIVLILGIVSAAAAQGRTVFLEDERDLGNGYKLCIYTEGVTITIKSHRLCPLSMEAP